MHGMRIGPGGPVARGSEVGVRDGCPCAGWVARVEYGAELGAAGADGWHARGIG